MTKMEWAKGIVRQHLMIDYPPIALSVDPKVRLGILHQFEFKFDLEDPNREIALLWTPLYRYLHPKPIQSKNHAGVILLGDACNWCYWHTSESFAPVPFGWINTIPQETQTFTTAKAINRKRSRATIS